MTGRMWTRAAAVGVVALVAGCASTVTGVAVKAPGDSGGDGVDVAQLTTGNYPIKPRAPLGVAGNPKRGGLAEGRRMAGFVVGPWQTDPALVKFEQFNTGVMKGGDSVNALLGAPIGDGLAGHNFVAGFSSARHTTAGPYKGLINVVLRLATPADASAAATDMAAKSGSLSLPFSEAPTPTRPTSIPRYPGTAAVGYSWTPSEGSTEPPRSAVIALTAHGSYVLAQAADSAAGPDNAAQMVATTLDLQQALIDKFTPTPVDQLPQLPLDPTGLLARTLPPKGADESTDDGVYEPHGDLHFQDDAAHEEALFNSVGLQQASFTLTSAVYQTPDAGSADRVVADFAAVATDFDKLRPAGSITGMPNAKCFAASLGFYCVARFDRYAFTAQNEQLGAVHQMIAAQYRILSGK
ncbi:hypothetical protein MSAS_08650 [Mycobacterium saskatchewanense]|uniref:Uncharacterized protein n=1 Tax=Mycobacterium saskatchewanense TaxID=220927 RepID=A0AAJ3NN07_9MYCO|nr:hypothetical protein [Mycobacterium saskatchewanense]ORW69040.1 hypothetical protein AWC23_20000 [Mycobacterium saskatchewanense]BBX61691.1 hypothetical protein MSAS_08650 [Mycobacterium saskatchewanense]